MDLVFYLYLIGSYTPLVADQNTWCARRIGVVDEEVLALRRSVHGGERRIEVATRTAVSVPRVVERARLGFSLGTVLLTKGILLPAKRGTKICERLKKKVIYIQHILAHHNSDFGRKGTD